MSLSQELQFWHLKYLVLSGSVSVCQLLFDTEADTPVYTLASLIKNVMW